jgi:hypothetical protein
MPSDPKSRARLANAQKAALHERLGGRCAECGATHPLEIDHPWGREWSPRKLTHYARVRRYIKEEAMGLIRLLCADCNKQIQPQRRPRDTAPPAEACPF